MEYIGDAAWFPGAVVTDGMVDQHFLDLYVEGTYRTLQKRCEFDVSWFCFMFMFGLESTYVTQVQQPKDLSRLR